MNPKKRMKLASRKVGPQIKSKTEDQNKALKALEGAAAHSKKIGNPDMAWVAAGACGLHGATFNSLVKSGHAERRPAPHSATRRWDYRLAKSITEK